ncbi:MAG: shikimate kinase [Ruminococcus sp.]|nr:shikimate kinase [Ruminococcus sp.]
MDKKLFLCGFMGCGKSTVGKAAAQKLNAELIDLDDYIVRTNGMSIPELFSAYGEAGFRDRETEAVRTVSAQQGNRIIALGGGAVLRVENVEMMKAAGTLIFLDVPFAVCFQRIRGDKNRPLAADSEESLKARYETRRAVYTSCADRVISLTGEETIQEIAERILTE